MAEPIHPNTSPNEGEGLPKSIWTNTEHQRSGSMNLGPNCTEGHEKDLKPLEVPPEHYYHHWVDDEDEEKLTCECGSSCGNICGEAQKLSLFIGIAAIIFPLLIWSGYALLPFDPPQINNAALRLVYTLRCSFFATIPIVLGVLVHGMTLLLYGTRRPLYDGRSKSKQVRLHWHYVSDSLSLFLIHVLQLAVMASYLSQERLKLVPLLTILFTCGRLIAWVCVAIGSSVRALGFGLSFLPILVMCGANLYFICSAFEEGVVFDVALPTTAPPPRQRWWG